MSKHSLPRSSSGGTPQLVLLLTGALLTAAVWVYLVGSAIDFAYFAQRGNDDAWKFSLGAALGAVVCLVLVLVLVGRALRLLGLVSDYRPRRSATRRRRD